MKKIYGVLTLAATLMGAILLLERTVTVAAAVLINGFISSAPARRPNAVV